MLDDTLRAFIAAVRVARLATADVHGRPHVVPICFALEGDILYTPVDEKPKRGDITRIRRLRNITHEPHVQVLVDVYDDADWSNLRYVQFRGRARIIEAGDEHARALAALRARYPQYRAMALESRPVIAVDIERAVHWQAR
ncbi:MAG: TIGR03668 family PPOX class F420-dependent oxidoreductase [Dehalococcoidia bacterium]